MISLAITMSSPVTSGLCSYDGKNVSVSYEFQFLTHLIDGVKALFLVIIYTKYSKGRFIGTVLISRTFINYLAKSVKECT